MISTFVQLPDPLQQAITALLVGLVVFVVHYAATNIPFLKFFEPYAPEWGMAIAAALLAWLSNAVPDAWGAVAIKALELVLAVFAVIFGLQKAAARRNVKGFTSAS